MSEPLAIDTGTEELLCRIEQRVAVVTLNKPEKKNALGDVLTPALRRTVAALEDDDRVGCVMITGAGDAFCSGGDVSEMGGGSTDAAPVSKSERIEALLQKEATLTLRIHELNKVTIAALPGAAAGAGLSIALSCDLRVAADTAFVTTAFANVGLSGDYGSSWFLPRLVGLARAKELFYTADRVYADEALRLGIVNRVFPKASFREDALAFVAAIANGPTQTLGRMKHNLNRGVEQDLRASLLLEAQQLVNAGGNPESREAIRAFMEKRKPRFHD
ncbi:MAG: enoyl-CoA hydratase-related protein [Pseudomonadota bacterium]